MFCKNCGKELNDNAKFCISCGFVVPEDSGGQRAGVQPGQPAFQQPQAPLPGYGQAPPPVPPGTPPPQQAQPPKPPAYQQQPQAPLPGYGQVPPPVPPGTPPPAQGHIPPQPGQPPRQPGQPGQPAYQQPQAQRPPYGQTPPPQGYAQPVQPGRPGYAQPGQPGQPGYAPQPPKKSKKPLFIAAGAAVAAVLVILLVIVPFAGNKNLNQGNTGDDDFSIDVYVDKPGGRELPFEPTQGGFSTNDQSIAMIEINQGLSYGFDTNAGEFYTMDNFVAGKDTAIFVSLKDPVDEKSEITLKIEKDGEQVATLMPLEIIDEKTILFQPKDMAEVNNWQQGAYTFTIEIDDKYAERTTNFFDSMQLKVLAVPVLANYSGRVVSCGDQWKNGAVMITAVYPIATENIDYVIGPEIDLSADIYDLNTDEGQYNVWKELKKLQTPNNDYTMIIGFVEEIMGDGSTMGYTWGSPANVVCQSQPGSFKTIVHEIAHCYLIGDEYDGGRGAFNDRLNPPPYGYVGWDIVTGNTVEGTNEKIKPAFEFGLNATGSIIYPEQRAYWAEGRQQMGMISSYMGASTGIDAFEYWTTSDIWNHLFKVFTGQAPEYLPTEIGTEYGAGGGSGGSTSGSTGGEYWGQCFNCYCDVYDPDMYVDCKSCQEPVLISGRVNSNNEFSCESCNAKLNMDDYNDNDLWLYCENCQCLLLYTTFVEFNSGSGEVSDSADQRIHAIRITGQFNTDGTFVANPWFAFDAAPTDLIMNKSGEYAVIIQDSKGEKLAVSYFDAVSRNQVTTMEGAEFRTTGTIVPIDVITKFPENAAKIVIQKDGKEVYSRTVSKSAPVVKFKGLSAGQSLDNKATLSWEASDADGDSLTYELWYCPKEDETFLVASDISGTSYQANMTDFPGTNDGFFRILATDGVLTGQGDSPSIKMPFKAPDILNDLEGKKYKVTDMVEIHGKVYDAQDGWLSDVGYTWYIDGQVWDDYEAFYFFQFPYMLRPGEHTITMKVTNSAGVSASKDFKIEIIEDESDLPNDWSRNDITAALRLGHYLPLKMLGSPVTRLEYAKMAFFLYSSVLPEDFEQIPGLEEVIQFNDMSNDEKDMDYLYAFVMVALGIMDAPDGNFNPYGSLTEREAMQIMYKAIELGRSQTVSTYEVMDESQFIPKLKEWGLFDEEGGPNVYQAGEKLTRKLAMVRTGRFLRYEFDLEDADYGLETGYVDLKTSNNVNNYLKKATGN